MQYYSVISIYGNYALFFICVNIIGYYINIKLIFIGKNVKNVKNNSK